MVPSPGNWVIVVRVGFFRDYLWIMQLCVIFEWSNRKNLLYTWRWYNSSLAITLAGEFSFCGQTTAPGYCTWRGRLLLTGEGHFRRCYKPNLTFDTCRGLFESFCATESNKKWKIITFSYKKVKYHYFFILKKWNIITFSCWKCKIVTFSYRKVTNLYLFVK